MLTCAPVKGSELRGEVAGWGMEPPAMGAGAEVAFARTPRGEDDGESLGRTAGAEGDPWMGELAGEGEEALDGVAEALGVTPGVPDGVGPVAGWLGCPVMGVPEGCGLADWLAGGWVAGGWVAGACDAGGCGLSGGGFGPGGLGMPLAVCALAAVIVSTDTTGAA